MHDAVRLGDGSISSLAIITALATGPNHFVNKHELMDRWLQWASWIPMYRSKLAKDGRTCIDDIIQHSATMV